MKIIFALSLNLLLSTALLAQDQHSLNAQAAAEFAKADKKLNQVYRQLVPRLSREEKNRLIDAQLLWIKYRDANATARAESCRGGSLHPMIYASAQRRVTESRIEELQEWLEETRSR